MSIWRYNPAEDDYEEIPPDEQDEQEEQEWPEEPDYCARCRYAGRCAGFCSVPPELM